MIATLPVTPGVAIEVPERDITPSAKPPALGRILGSQKPPAFADKMNFPGAITSGLVRPSNVGPLLEKSATYAGPNCPLDKSASSLLAAPTGEGKT